MQQLLDTAQFSGKSGCHNVFVKHFYLFIKYFREMVCSEMLELKAVNKIGGPGCTVEVDESMFGHCKVRTFVLP